MSTVRARAAFLHVSKCAGTSVVDALVDRLGPGTRPAATFDTCYVAGFDGDGVLPRDVAAMVRWDDQPVLAGPHAVGHHWSLPTLLRAFEPADIATVLREPRLRILSYLQFARGLPPRNRRRWRPDPVPDLIVRAPLVDALADPRCSRALDNLITRQLLWGDPRIPVGGFIDAADIEPLAHDALAALARLGFVGTVECQDHVVAGLGAWLGTGLDLGHANRTVTRQVPGLLRSPAEVPLARDLLLERTRADRIVWAHVARIAGLADPSRSAERALDTRLAALCATAFYARLDEVPAGPALDQAHPDPRSAGSPSPSPEQPEPVAPAGGPYGRLAEEIRGHRPRRALLVDLPAPMDLRALSPVPDVIAVADDPDLAEAHRQAGARVLTVVDAELVDVSLALAGRDFDLVVVGPDVIWRARPGDLLTQLELLLGSAGRVLLQLPPDQAAPGRARRVLQAAVPAGWLPAQEMPGPAGWTLAWLLPARPAT